MIEGNLEFFAKFGNGDDQQTFPLEYMYYTVMDWSIYLMTHAVDKKNPKNVLTHGAWGDI